LAGKELAPLRAGLGLATQVGQFGDDVVWRFDSIEPDQLEHIRIALQQGLIKSAALLQEYPDASLLRVAHEYTGRLALDWKVAGSVEPARDDWLRSLGIE
jgi:hypothetical protein